jgi:hypothetical protein
MAKPSSSRTRSIEAAISDFTVSASPVLPGQSAEQYQTGLESLITELQAKTPMQVYLAQKMFDCMWWLRTYDMAKHLAIADAMISVLDLDPAEQEHWPLIKCLRSLDWSNELLVQEAQEWGHTMPSLHAQALSRARDELYNLEQLSAIRTKTLMQLQASYEALVSRSILQERLRLQNQLLTRNVSAIESQKLGSGS